jgi:2-oxoglutarate dehydrogenase E2 component (dihydrolipoamide succinyltransferase)
VIEEIIYDVNAVVPIGTVIARIRTEIKESAASTRPAAPEPGLPEASLHQPEHTSTPTHTGDGTGRLRNATMTKFYSPLVLNIAANENISRSELETIPGTGNDSRVTKKDILQYVEKRKTGESERVQGAPLIHSPQVSNPMPGRKNRFIRPWIPMASLPSQQ